MSLSKEFRNYIIPILFLSPVFSFSQNADSVDYWLKKYPFYYAHYPGKIDGWFKTVEQSMNLKGLHNSFKKDSASIVVKFLVLENGEINKIQFDSGDQVLLQPVTNLLLKSGKWYPAIQGGREVKNYRKIRLQFKFNKKKKIWELVRNEDDYLHFK